MFHGRRNREYWNACKEVQTYEEIDIQEIPLSSPIYRKRVETFLTANGLRFEEVDSYYALLDKDGEIIAGAGLHNDVVKCVAVDAEARSGGLLAPLLSYIISHASAQGISNLKVFTKPENEGIFRSLGFHLIASAPKAVLMENGHGLEDYLSTLTASVIPAGLPSEPGREASSLPESTPLHPLGGLRGVPLRLPESLRFEQSISPAASPAVGVIVMNANPFTLGHQYLVRKASEAVDRLYVIPVMHDIPASFHYVERLAMIKAGCGDLATVLEGSAYQISDITFPTYFLKDLSDASETQICLDLDLFGRHIAPALGVTVRFVGSEPSDPLTARYNELMKEILPAYGITVVEVPRLTADYTGLPSEPGRVHPRFAAAEYGLSPEADPVNASSVRRHLEAGLFFEAAKLTPATTWPYLVAELMARALRMELDAPLKPGLVDPTSDGAHSDMDYALMKGSIDVIRRSFVRHLLEQTDCINLCNTSHSAHGDVHAHCDAPSHGNVRDSEYADYQFINDICPDQTDESYIAKGHKINNLQITPSSLSSACKALSSFGKAIEADVLDFTGGVNTYRGAIFALGLASIAALESATSAKPQEPDAQCLEGCGGQVADNQLTNQNDHGKNGGIKTRKIFIDNDLGATAFFSGCRNGSELFTADELSATISCLANMIKPAEDSNGAKAVNEYGVKGALQMAREGYKPLFEDWLPYYRSMAPEVTVDASGLRPYSAAADPWRLQKTLLRIMSRLDDTCVIHRVGYERAQEVKKEAKALLEKIERRDGSETTEEIEGKREMIELENMKDRYDAEGISPGGAADMLALTILVDSLLG